ncbi:hypothetical protein F506_17920 [Herbaspirillum hiltneri N3]|uniref:Inovirus Gp2 family protein n=1 Tax=Herbaspirillum hiltneri N3 TaxID=1262470 RepID=A0ABM5V3U4_9BURK|nr:inovirus-type Gp2 protein [Herbaspirillum hiltneri]AKZ64292.1 hypothetical protein F506_17920 [Herbaspirillum hiltneri N3]
MDQENESRQLGMQQVCAAALEQEFNAVTSVDGKTYMVGDRTARLARLIQFVDLVLKSKSVAFIVTGQGMYERRAKEASKLAAFYKGFHVFYTLYSVDVEYSPDIALFFECVRNHPVRTCTFEKYNASITSELIEADVFNQFIEDMRTQAKAQGTNKKVNDWARNARKNQARLVEYLDAKFDQHSRLEVVRVDLLYREASLDKASYPAANGRLHNAAHQEQRHFLYGHELPKERETFARIDVNAAKADITRFLKEKHRELAFEYLVGYVIKMEWSRWSGYHFHCAFLFDGAHVQNGYWLAKQLGDYWAQVTDNRGFAHNCNQDQRSYRNWGIGRVEAHDVEKRASLYLALSYLTKRDQYVRVKPGEKHRVFQTGGLKPYNKNIGRPRSKGVSASEPWPAKVQSTRPRKASNVEVLNIPLMDVTNLAGTSAEASGTASQ